MSVQERQTSITVMTLAAGMLAMAGWAMSAGAESPGVVSPGAAAVADTAEPDTEKKPAVDTSGQKRVGKASFYASRFGGRPPGLQKHTHRGAGAVGKRCGRPGAPVAGAGERLYDAGQPGLGTR